MIYAIEDLIARSPAEGPRAASETRDAPGLPYRIFWTWDHSTNWELSQIGQQEIGVFNPFQKPPRGFLDDYRRLVDWCSRNRIPAVTIFGFLRNSHGGIAAAQELARYGRERGVRIMPGIAIGAYGGVYWEGDHPFNLATWLKKHPQFSAQLEKGVGFQLQDLAFPLNFPASDYTLTACPSAPETMDWMTDAVSWLAETSTSAESTSKAATTASAAASAAARGAQRRGSGAPGRHVRQFLVPHRHGVEFSPPLRRRKGEEAGTVDVLRDAVGQSARSSGERGAEAVAARRDCSARRARLTGRSCARG